MNCPFCKKEIYAMTGLTEIQKFIKHLNYSCREAPGRTFTVNPETGRKAYQNRIVDMREALAIRSASGQ